MKWRQLRRSVLTPAYLRDRRKLTLLFDHGSASGNRQGTGKFRTRSLLHLDYTIGSISVIRISYMHTNR